MKNNELNIKELTQREISRINTDEKMNKIKRENARLKRDIVRLRDNEKKYKLQLGALAGKIDFVKENTIGSLFTLSENINGIKESFIDYCDNLVESRERESLKSFSKEFDYISDFIINVCNSIEMSSKHEAQDSEGEFEEREYAENSDNTSAWELESGSADSKQSEIAAEKIKKMFYETPTEGSNSVSGDNYFSDDFDFNEALNPTMSLSDIMADLAPSKQKSNIMSSSYEDTDDEELAENEKNYDEYFKSLQNIVTKETK